ncbi:hypothetical protein BFW01_g295 [Lasiodiplodia theobromae]|uniref:EF-hand domain-containing protein n=1 Tax=Lasiodiplodia theobromae TaxID=45133 RepID=A0A8H7MB70_9PEZI|nr:hypothetical protein BFW01_g295 [Lasiodiplodia theobromae]
MQPSTIFAILSVLAPFAAAHCCHVINENNECRDGSWGTPCCGQGGCNIFCCNCDGGCRSDNRKLASRATIDGAADADSFSVADVDGTGNLTLAQYTQYMGATEDDEIYVNWFKQHDKNGDGVVTPDEVRLN